MQREKQEQRSPQELRAWYDQDDFFWSVRQWSAKIGVQAPAISFEENRRRWGTTTIPFVARNIATRNSIAFDTALLTMPRYLGEVVIVHELVHILCPQSGHNVLWKQFMNAYLPDWRQREAELAQFALESQETQDQRQARRARAHRTIC
jgi:predicted metal-dependent hydrolase